MVHNISFWWGRGALLPYCEQCATSVKCYCCRYEVSFRDLYPWGPICDCQQSIKYVNEKEGYIDDYFVFSCGLDGFMHFISPQRENRTNASSGLLHENGVYDMYVRHSDFKMITHYEWNTEMIGFKDDGQDQYEWVIEFQCGTRPNLPKEVCLDQTVDGQCFFTGVQLYVRDLDNVEKGREEMIAYLRSLCVRAVVSYQRSICSVNSSNIMYRYVQCRNL